MIRSIISGVLGILLMISGCAGLRVQRPMKPAGVDWTMYGGSPGRANATVETLRLPLEEVWQYNAQAGLMGSPLVRDSVMILGTLNGELQAVNLTNGKRIGYKVLESPIVGTPALDGVSVIVTLSGKLETLLSYDLQAGKRSWVFPAGPIETSPLVVDDNIYVTTLSGHVFCVQKRTGEEVWNVEITKNDVPVTIRSSPSSMENIVAFGSDEGILYGMERSSGRIVWSVETGSSIFATPIVSSGGFVVGNLDGHVYCVEGTTGATRWKFSTGSRVFGPAASNEGVVIVGSADGVLHAVDDRHGSEKWRFTAGSVINSAPLIAGTLLFAGSLDKTLYALDWSTGKEQWRYLADGRIKVSPVAWGDFLLVTSEDKYITALRPSKPL